MIVDCISDTHGSYPKLEGGDLLIVAGDLTARDSENEHALFDYWLNEQKYNTKIVIAGNHDGFLESSGKNAYGLGHKYIQFGTYLQDEAVSFNGFKIYGSPWTPTFYDWHFMKDRGEPIKAMWDLIPEDVDILVTHGPPYGILDKVKFSSKGNKNGHAGCEELLKALERLKPKLHVFGHIHEGYGQTIYKRPGYGDENNTICVNACIMNEHYWPVNKPIRIEL